MAPPDAATAGTGDFVTRLSEPMHVLLLSKSFSAPGGVVNFVRSVLEYLPAGTRPEHLAIGREPQRERRLASLFAPLRDNLRLARRARSGNYHCVHVNPSMNLPSLLRDGMFLLTLRLSGQAGVLVHFHGWDVPQAERLVRNGLARALFRLSFGHARVICVLATPFRKTLIDAGIPPERVEVTTTMFNTRIFDGVERRSSGARPRLLFLSRLVREKGPFETIDAFALLRHAGVDAELVLAGDGPERDALERHASERDVAQHVSFPGYLDGTEKAQALLDADVFVFPTSHYEGCPVSLLEAMAAGLPVITTAMGGIPDVFEHGRNGIVLERVNAEALAVTLRELLADPERRAAIAASNREDAWSKYRAEAVIERLTGLYEHAAGRT